MRTIKKLVLPNQRAFLERHIVQGSVALSNFALGQETGSSACSDNPCEHGVLVCEDGGCLDDFNDRTVSVGEGWGTGDLGEWILEQANEDPPEEFISNMSVGDGHGLYTLEIGDQQSGWAYINGRTLSAPIEVLVKFAIEFSWDSSNIEWALQFDGESGPRNSVDWIYCYMDDVTTTGTFANHSFSLNFSLQTSEGGGEDEPDLFEHTGIINDAMERWDLWMRMRVDSDGVVHARVWEDGDTEPALWTMEDLTGDMADKQFPYVGLWLAPETDGVVFTIFETDSFEITEGCIGGSGCIVYFQHGDTFDVDDSSITASVYGECIASGTTTYLLPSTTMGISEVYIDMLPTDVWYYDPEQNSIVFPADLISGTQVYAKYLYQT